MVSYLMRHLARVCQFPLEVIGIHRKIEKFCRCGGKSSVGHCVYIQSSAGFTVSIYCDELWFDMRFSWGLPKNKRVVIYKLYSVCSNNTPEIISKRFEQVLCIPPLLSRLSSRHYQHQAAVDAYIGYLHNGLISA